MADEYSRKSKPREEKEFTKYATTKGGEVRIKRSVRLMKKLIREGF